MVATNGTPPDATPTTRPLEVTRSIDIDAGVDDVWQLLRERDGLSGWLGDDVDLDVRPGGAGRVIDADGSRRDVLVTDVEDADPAADGAARLAWHWWLEDGPLSSVEITVVPTPTGTRVTVTERLAVLRARAGLDGGPPAPAARAGAGGGGAVSLDRGDLDGRLHDAWAVRLGRLRVRAASPRVALAG